MLGLASSHSALPTVVRAPPDGNGPPPCDAPGGAAANGSFGQARIVYVRSRPPPCGSATSGVTISGRLLAGSTVGLRGSVRSTLSTISDGSTCTASARRSITVVGSSKFVHAPATMRAARAASAPARAPQNRPLAPSTGKIGMPRNGADARDR